MFAIILSEFKATAPWHNYKAVGLGFFPLFIYILLWITSPSLESNKILRTYSSNPIIFKQGSNFCKMDPFA